MSHTPREAVPDESRIGDEQSEEAYEVVLSSENGYSEEHAKLLRQRLLADGFFEDVVTVRKERDSNTTE
jgi:hypothetical protein